MTLIDSATQQILSARYFVAAGALFGIDQSSVRVALGRLVKDGSLQQSGRGLYQLGSRGGALHRLVRNWARVESSVKPWTGQWLAVFSAHLSRQDKTALRGRERALRLFGFAQPEIGLWIRPDNLVLELTSLREALIDLGLEPAALTYTMTDLAPKDTVDYGLWDRSGLAERYRRNHNWLKESHALLAMAADERANEEIGRTTLLLGRAVTRDILLDPLLPQEMVDVSLRQQMVEEMRRYDRLGKNFWRHFEVQHNNPGD